MALSSAAISVGTSAVALHTAGPTSITIRNAGLTKVFLGVSGAGNQKFSLLASEYVTLTIAATDVVYAVSESGTNQVDVIHN